jgi:hypothetical protein
VTVAYLRRGEEVAGFIAEVADFALSCLISCDYYCLNGLLLVKAYKVMTQFG